jgi:hypothetical protein
MPVNKIIKDAFDADDTIPKELSTFINRLLDTEEQDSYLNKDDSIAKIIEQRVEKSGLVDNKEFVEWCDNYE